METDDDLKYGWWKWRPKCAQWLNKAAWYTICVCYANGVMCFMKDGLNGVVLSSIERRFGLSSSQSSLMVSAFDIATIPTILVVSYVGAKGHRTMWIAWTMFLFSVAAILFALPHYTTGKYEPGGLLSNNLCRNRSNVTTCSVGDGGGHSASSLADYLWVFVIARVLMGVGSTPLYSMGITFLDDIVSRDAFSLHVAFFFSFGVIGPAVGYIGGGQILNLYTDFDSVDPAELGLTPKDPRWVGAWWLGFLIGGAAMFLVVLPLAGFKRDIPGAQKIREAKKSEAHGQDTDDSMTEMDFGKLRDLPKSLMILIKNPAFMFSAFYGMMDAILIAGFTAFGPKYVENQFSMAAGFAGMIFGLITIPGGAGGTIISGYLVKWFRLSARGIMRTSALCNTLIIFLSLMFFITCEGVRFPGVNVPYENSTAIKNLTAPCNVGCHCDGLQYSPICSADNKRYFSPCHAGCTDLVDSESATRYFNCSCISAVSGPSGESATSNSCTAASCKLLPLFLVILFGAMFLTFVCNTLSISTLVRVVPTAQKSLAVGVNWIFVRVIGSVPGPIIFGAAFDGSCTLWEGRCGARGSCLSYDNARLGAYMFLVCAGVKFVALIFIFVAWRVYKTPIDNDVIATTDVKVAHGDNSENSDQHVLTTQN